MTAATVEASVSATAPTAVRAPHGALVCASVSAASSALYWGWFQRRYRPTSDANHYDGIARNIASGRGFSHVFPGLRLHATAFRPPLYPSLLALVYRTVGARVGAGMALSLALGMAVAVAVFAVVRDLGGNRAGTVAGCTAAVYPPLLANTTALLTEPLGLVLLLGTLWSLLHRRAALAGVAAGLVAMTWTSGQFFCVAAVAWAALRLGWRRALVVTCAAAVVVVPWVVRNEVRLGVATLNTSNGFNLTATYSREASAKDVYFVDETVDDHFDTVHWRALQQHEAAWDAALRGHGVDGFVAHPGHAWTLLHRNVGLMLERKPSLSRQTDAIDGRARTVRDVGARLFPFVSLLGLVGLIRHRHLRGVALLGAVTAVFVTVDLLTVMAPRLRDVFDLACCIGTGLAVAGPRSIVGVVRPGRDDAGAAPSQAAHGALGPDRLA